MRKEKVSSDYRKVEFNYYIAPPETEQDYENMR